MKYLLTFKPLKYFFFGNDTTFSDDYFAVSSYFPQNTQLLGAIRLFIAEQKGLMKEHLKGRWCDKPEELKKLTGTATQYTFESNDNLGKIDKLSPMFIVTKELNDAYFLTPFDIEVTQEKKDSKNIKKVRKYTLEKFANEYILIDYDAKKASYQMLGSSKFWQSYINNNPSADGLKDISEIFAKHTQVGIELEDKRVVDEQFYSKTDYKLEDGYLFGAVIELQEEIIKDGIIQIGAEGSIFELKVQKLEDTKLMSHPIIASIFNEPQIGDKAVFISDAMVEHTDSLNAKYKLIPYYKNFMLLKKKLASKNSKKEQKRLIPAGSVIYLNDTLAPKAKGAYAKMGYNQYITIKGEK